MPMYEYMCVVCGNEFELLASFSKADAAQICPKCGSDQSRRQLSAFAFGGGNKSASPAMAGARPFT